MRRHQEKDIENARLLRRREGYSFAHLQRLTGIPATTIRNWCSDNVLGTRWDTLLRSNERKRQELKTSESSVTDSITGIDRSSAKIFAAILYACEGSKYPATNRVAFTNSDPNLIKLFINLLRKGFVLDESKFTVRLQIHDTHDFEKVKTFWSNLLYISPSRFLKPTITRANGKKHRKEYLGTCAVVYTDFRIQLKLMGISELFIKKFGEVI